MKNCEKTNSSGKWLGLSLLLLFIVFGYGFLICQPDGKSIRAFSLIFASIILEAMPFMLFGALVGGLIEAYVSREHMTAILPKRAWVTVMLAAGMGIVFPVCECAVVPMMRRLARKGLPPPAAISYLLGTPILNPIVAGSTALAYQFNWKIVALRMSLGYAIAVFIALIMGKLFAKESMFLEGVQDSHHDHDDDCCCCHEHDHDHGHAEEPHKGGYKLMAAARHARHDFLDVVHYLIVGAFIAALAQTYVDRKVILSITENPVLPIMAMILLAVMLNLCSEADAFIAASFRGLMPLSSQMAFMLAGPMFDLKLLLMYQKVFRKRTIVALSLLILSTVFIVSFGLKFMIEVLK